MMENDFFTLRVPSIEEREQWVTRRDGEFRIGQQTLFRTEDPESWKQRKYHVLGIKEDIGPRANGGFGGSDKAFDVFISRFLAVQSNRFLSGEELVVHGVIEPIKTEQELSLKELVAQLDELVISWSKEVTLAGGIPIVIGGGHNNAFGLIKGTSEGSGKQLSIVNLDPHADTRDLEGRHSGNPFSYAWGEGLLSSYSVMGLHQSYNNESVLKRLELMKATIRFFEDWIDEPERLHTDIIALLEQHKDRFTGIELDMDSIAGMPSSAFTPSGVTVEQARFYVRSMARVNQVAYIHFPEAAPVSERDGQLVGKSLSYLVADFIKCHNSVREK
jgi:formiminoglutamase